METNNTTRNISDIMKSKENFWKGLTFISLAFMSMQIISTISLIFDINDVYNGFAGDAFGGIAFLVVAIISLFYTMNKEKQRNTSMIMHHIGDLVMLAIGLYLLDGQGILSSELNMWTFIYAMCLIHMAWRRSGYISTLKNKSV